MDWPANAVVGSYTVIATISGLDRSATFVLSNLRGRPRLVLSASPNPAQLGSNVMLTATLSAASPSGFVTFYDGASVLGKGKVSAAGTA